MKEESKKYWIIGGIALVVVLALNKWIKSMPKPINSDDYAGLNLDSVLSKGSTGDEVFELQKILVNQYGADLGFTGADKDGIDGEFGSLTEKALLKAKGVKGITLRQIITKK
jgi:hypothetical protein